MIKKICVLIVVLAFIACGIVPAEFLPRVEAQKNKTNRSNIYFIKNNIKSNHQKENYIVITKHKNEMNHLEDQYGIVNESMNCVYGERENITTLEITGDQARNIQKKDEVLCVEKDVEVKGCSAYVPFKKRKVIRKKVKTDEEKKSWNKKMIKADKTSKKFNSAKIKVAVLDSGLNYANDIEYKEQINFVEGEEDLSPLFVDDTGHGTSVAGIIAAEDNDEGITGINPNVELYSARVLAHDNSAPVSRIVEGIYWAIEKKVNIINLSFSTPQNSQILKKAIKDAYNNNILIVAAAGNSGKVEYPAAYKEVMAVGAVNSIGEQATSSASGEELEIVAPGEEITSSSLLGGTMTVSGTSLAAPHIVGVAALLWQRDISVSSRFIRALLDYSANSYGTKEDYGYGLVDYTYADSIFDDFKEEYSEDILIDEQTFSISENASECIEYEGVPNVTGKWQNHAGLVKSYSNVVCLQEGARDADTLEGITGLGVNHAWHGGRFCNYVADYRYLVKVANAVGKLDGSATKSEINKKINDVAAVAGMNDDQWDYLQYKSPKYSCGTYSRMKADLKAYITPRLVGKSKANKKAYIFGLASHIATDVFAHTTFRYTGNAWSYITHKKKANGTMDSNNPLHADNTACVQRRYDSAKAVLEKVIDRYNGNRADIAIVRDFQIAKTDTPAEKRRYYNAQAIKYTETVQNIDATYRLYNLKNYMATAGETSNAVLSIYGEVTTTIVTNYK